MSFYPNQYVLCRQINGLLEFSHFNCYESRGKSVEKMIRDSVSRYNIHRDFLFIVNTDDVPRGELKDIPVFHFCNNNNYDMLFPDFFYESWPEVSVSNYASETLRFKSLADPPQTDKIGWIGTLLCDKRREIYEKFSNDSRFEIVPIEWIQRPDGSLYASKYMSYIDQFKKWKYFLDIEGGGWSARLKTLLSIPRVTFVVDREWKDWCWNFIKPWKHYVPIKRDLSDLEENYKQVVEDNKLQDYIINENKKLYDVCLSYDSALSQIKNIIHTLR